MNVQVDSIHTVIWLSSLVGIIICIYRIYILRSKSGFCIAPFIYFLNVFAYNTALHFGLLPAQQLDFWSGIVRLHSIFLFIALVILQPLRRNMRNEPLADNKNN